MPFSPLKLSKHSYIIYIITNKYVNIPLYSLPQKPFVPFPLKKSWRMSLNRALIVEVLSGCCAVMYT